MARTEDPDRLTNAEATSFRKLMRRVMDLKGLTYVDLADALANDDDKWSDEQSVRNRLKLGPRPILAPDARAIWRAVAALQSRRGHKGKFSSDQALVQRLVPRPGWMQRYEIRLGGPGVNLPSSQISALASMIGMKVASTTAARKVAQRKIATLLMAQSAKMNSRWYDLAMDYAGAIAASAGRGEYAWKDRFTGENVIRLQRGKYGNDDVRVVMETIFLLVSGQWIGNIGYGSAREGVERIQPRGEVSDPYKP